MSELKQNIIATNQTNGSSEFESPIRKILKVDDGDVDVTPILSADKENDNNPNFNIKKNYGTSYDHINHLSMEEGAILLDKWTNNNFADFESWLQNANAQVSLYSLMLRLLSILKKKSALTRNQPKPKQSRSKISNVI